MKKEDISSLNQLIKNFENKEKELEENYEKRNSLSFNSTQKLLVEIQNKILKILE